MNIEWSNEVPDLPSDVVDLSGSEEGQEQGPGGISERLYHDGEDDLVEPDFQPSQVTGAAASAGPQSHMSTHSQSDESFDALLRQRQQERRQKKQLKKSYVLQQRLVQVVTGTQDPQHAKKKTLSHSHVRELARTHPDASAIAEQVWSVHAKKMQQLTANAAPRASSSSSSSSSQYESIAIESEEAFPQLNPSKPIQPVKQTMPPTAYAAVTAEMAKPTPATTSEFPDLNDSMIKLKVRNDSSNSSDNRNGNRNPKKNSSVSILHNQNVHTWNHNAHNQQNQHRHHISQPIHTTPSVVLADDEWGSANTASVSIKPSLQAYLGGTGDNFEKKKLYVPPKWVSRVTTADSVTLPDDEWSSSTDGLDKGNASTMNAVTGSLTERGANNKTQNSRTSIRKGKGNTPIDHYNKDHRNNMAANERKNTKNSQPVSKNTKDSQPVSIKNDSAISVWEGASEEDDWVL
ncbi:hypothetical protein BJ741DRAFT_664285 [Chytriomyces cf. hyalinus JEL632]|nr:hypothetical protein BJ741DRAFT_664285 [Chytriomyces cf. hyalinus JEL632]